MVYKIATYFKTISGTEFMIVFLHLLFSFSWPGPAFQGVPTVSSKGGRFEFVGPSSLQFFDTFPKFQRKIENS